MDKQDIMRCAIASIIALGASTIGQGGPVAPDPSKDKCYGISKAGQNDCASKTGAHACAGLSTKDNDMGDWKYVAKGTCQQMGGKMM